MQKTVNFKKKIIASAIASAIGFSGVAFAQDDAEEIVITGIKASLARAMDIKRDAAGVVDAISAEDIGKMPDANLAESLQRISGVSIDRSGGEGSKVTVRGLAGDYNLVTLNGRQMPASSTSTGNISTSRSFDFANLASEGVAGVEVYKTGRADVATGGMGALINIITPHPLKRPGMHASVGVKAVSDDSSHIGADVTPEISGIYSNTFADDTFGVAVTGSYQEREFGTNEAFVADWFNGKGARDIPNPVTPSGPPLIPGNFQGDWGSLGQGWAGNTSVAPTSTTQVYSNPINFGYRITDSKRTRTNGGLALEYKPIDTLTVGVDYTYVRQDVDNEAHSISTWFNRSTGTPTATWTDNQTGPIGLLTYSEVNPNPTDLAMDAQKTGTRNELNSVGINVKFEASDNLKFEFDGHNSVSESKPNSVYGTNNSLTVQSRTNYNPAVDFRHELPILTMTLQPGTAAAPTPAQMQLTGSTFRNTRQEAKVDQYQLKGAYSFDESVLKAINFGVASTEIDNHSQYAVVDLQNHGNWGGVGNVGAFGANPNVWRTDKLSNYFSDEKMKNSLNTFMNFDLKTVTDLAAAQVYVPASTDPVTGVVTPASGYSSATVTPNSPCAKAYCAPTQYINISPNAFGGQGATDYQTVETSTSGYVQGQFEGDYNGMPVHVLAGLRYETTDVTSTSLVPVQLDAIWSGTNEFTINTNGKDSYFSEDATYDMFLPSIDYDIGLTDSVKVRASYSKTIARPNYADIRGGYSVGGVRVGATSANASAGAGNPGLKPLGSTNGDLSAEWYYADASYISAGYFVKDLKDFIGTGVRNTTSETMHSPVGGARYNAAVAAGANGSEQIRAYIISHSAVGDPGVSGNNIYAVAGDPLVAVSISSPANTENFLIHGFELAVQHTFGESGFGFMANLTKVDSSASYDKNGMGAQFAPLGISDSYNLVAFYDKDGLQGRLAYNWRDGFLNSIVYSGDTPSGNPRFVQAYGQLDASVSYDIIENLTVALEGSNLTNEHTRTHGREWHELLNYTETGARYDISVRYKF
jgi:TonB-dependent receptor